MPTSLPALRQPVPGPALTPAAPGTWQTFQSADGLPYPSATSLAADSAGGVWAGTARGAAHFDGRRWTAYRAANGLLSDLVLALAIDAGGTAWFGTDKGVARFDGRTWTSYTAADGLPSGFVQVVELDRRGGVWFGVTGAGGDWAFGNGAARLDDGGTAAKSDDRWQLFPPTRERMAGDVVSGLADLGAAGIWFAVTPEGTVRADSGRGGLWRLLGSETPDSADDSWTAARAAAGLPGDAVTAVAAGLQGDVWVGTTAGMLHLSSEAVKAFVFFQAERLSVQNGLPSNRILAVAVGPDGRVWVGTDAGLAVIAGGRIETLTAADGLADNRIRAIAIAADGSVWVATPSGVSRLIPTP